MKKNKIIDSTKTKELIQFNLLSNSKKLPYFFFLLSFILLNTYIGIKCLQKSNYANHFIRFHVVANSNNISDQIEKLQVSQKLNDYFATLNLSKKASKEDVLATLHQHITDILAITNQASSYTTTLKLGKIEYEQKENMIYDMPSGTYDSMQIILGEGKGKNIWSLISPNEENIQKIQNYETILPEITSLYPKHSNHQEKREYSIKLFEILKETIF